MVVDMGYWTKVLKRIAIFIGTIGTKMHAIPKIMNIINKIRLSN